MLCTVPFGGAVWWSTYVPHNKTEIQLENVGTAGRCLVGAACRSLHGRPHYKLHGLLAAASLFSLHSLSAGCPAAAFRLD